MCKGIFRIWFPLFFVRNAYRMTAAATRAISTIERKKTNALIHTYSHSQAYTRARKVRWLRALAVCLVCLLCVLCVVRTWEIAPLIIISAGTTFYRVVIVSRCQSYTSRHRCYPFALPPLHPPHLVVVAICCCHLYGHLFSSSSWLVSLSSSSTSSSSFYSCCFCRLL